MLYGVEGVGALLGADLRHPTVPVGRVYRRVLSGLDALIIHDGDQVGPRGQGAYLTVGDGRGDGVDQPQVAGDFATNAFHRAGGGVQTVSGHDDRKGFGRIRTLVKTWLDIRRHLRRCGYRSGPSGDDAGDNDGHYDEVQFMLH